MPAIKTIRSLIRDIPAYPQQGVIFRDITPLLRKSDALSLALELMLAPVAHESIDAVVGIEARGFIFAAMAAQRLGAGIIPARKQGKLPRTTKKAKYSLEYGEDTLEMHADAITAGERILLIDDVIATGGTARAATELVESLGGKIIACTFLIEIKALEGRKKIAPRPTHAVVDY